ncbi:unnamed protein product [Ceratitis capitata]|uniref:(Mediterranean fruit fly) hypothetical protein n=1 Tax=Ceratitis capitata TaxID=7213 RepID=A0A811UY63_CERCA|nr:unnamed protein product [Ceratitis capitata]
MMDFGWGFVGLLVGMGGVVGMVVGTVGVVGMVVGMIGVVGMVVGMVCVVGMVVGMVGVVGMVVGMKSRVFVLKVTLRNSSKSSSQERLSPKLFCSIGLLNRHRIQLKVDFKVDYFLVVGT